MNVKFLRDVSHVIDKMATRHIPKDWVGSVPPDVLSKFIDGMDYEVLPPDPDPLPPGAQFTPEQAAILAAAADEAKRAAEAAALAEPVTTPNDVDLDKMTVVELRAIAEQLLIPGAARMKKAELIAALEERRA